MQKQRSEPPTCAQALAHKRKEDLKKQGQKLDEAVKNMS